MAQRALSHIMMIIPLSMLVFIMIALNGGHQVPAFGYRGAANIALPSECPDPYEPNDWFTQATDVEFDAEYAAYVCNSDDLDYYRFYLDAGQQVVIDLYNMELNSDLDLYGPGETLIASSTNPGDTPEQIIYTAQESGTHYALVYGTEGELVNPYTLRVTAASQATDTPTPTPTPTSGLGETCTQILTNGSFEVGLLAWQWTSTADIPDPITAEWASDGIYSALLSHGDSQTNHLRQPFTLPLNTTRLTLTYDLLIDGPSDAGDTLDVVLENGSTGQFTQITRHIGDPGQGSFSTDLTPYLSGFDTLRFTATTNAQNLTRFFLDNVRLTACGTNLATATPTPTPTPTATPRYPGCPDPWEPNDTFDEAFWSIVDAPTVSYICAVADQDYWLLPSISISQTMKVQLYDLPQDYDLFLYRPDRTRATSSVLSGTPDELARFTADRSGTWYAQVTGKGRYFDTSRPYTILAQVFNCQMDRLEPNDPYYKAWELRNTRDHTEVHDNLSICPPGDRDWFVLQADQGDRLIAEVTYTSSQGQMFLCLVDMSTGNRLNCATVPINNTLRIDTFPTKSDYFYLEVGPQVDGDIIHRYRLSARVNSATPTPTSTPTMTPTPTSTPTPTWTPTPTPTPTLTPTPVVCPPSAYVPRPTVLDLQLIDMEVTQSIQNLDNDVPLIAGKRTYVRLYTKGDRKVTVSTRGWLRAKRDGVSLGTAPVPCANSPVIRFYPGSEKYARNNTITGGLYCPIPPSWVARSGTLEITAQVDAPCTSDPASHNNIRTVTMTVEPSPPLDIKIVQVRDGCTTNCQETNGLSYNDYKHIHLVAQRMYPLSRITLHPHRTWIQFGRTVGVMQAQLIRLRSLVKGPNTVALAVVRDSTDTRKFNGFCSDKWRVGWVKVHPKDPERTGGTFAHEIAHCLGMHHVSDGLTAGPYEPYPYPGTQLSQGGERDYYGLDTGFSPPLIKNPTVFADIMTYQLNRWISDYTFRKLKKRLQGGTPSPAPLQPASQEGEYLEVVGAIDPRTEQITLLPMMRLPASEVSAMAWGESEGEYAVRLLAADGTVLAEQPFTPLPGVDTEDAPLPFAVWVPYDARTTRIVIAHQGAELTSTTVSPNPPVITLDPVSDIVPDTLTLSWEMADPDGDALTATVYFSADAGETWEPLAIDIKETQVELDTSLWPETQQGMLRVRITDGVNTAEDMTGPFTVPAKPPMVSILAPQDGAGMFLGSSVLLSAIGYDAEDGALPDEAYSWHSDRDGDLGIGQEILASQLSLGRHRITVTVTDDDGNHASDAIDIYVNRQIFFPTMLRELPLGAP